MKLIHGVSRFALRLSIVSGILLVACFSHGTNSGRCQYPASNTHAKIALTPSGMQKIVSTSLQMVLPEVFEELQGIEIGDWEMSPSDPKCLNRENYITLEVAESWRDCYGFPRFFTGEPISLFQLKLGAMPEPSKIELINVRLQSFEFGKIKLRCTLEGCDFDVPIKHIKFSGDLLFESLWSKKPVFYAKNLYLKLSEHEGVLPKVSFRAPLDPIGGGKNFLDLAKDSAQVTIPAGGLELESNLSEEERIKILRKVLRKLYGQFKEKLGFPDKNDEREILIFMAEEADSMTYKSEEYKKAFETEIEKEFADYFGSVSSLGTFHLVTQLTTPEMQTSERIKPMFETLSKMVGRELMPIVIEMINESVSEVPVFHEAYDYSFPMIRLQDYIDTEKQEAAVDKMLNRLKNLNSNLTSIEDLRQLKKFLGKNRTENPFYTASHRTQDVLNMFKDSINLQSLTLVSLLTRAWKTIDVSTSTLRNKLLLRGNRTKDIKRLFTDKTKYIEDNISKIQNTFLAVLAEITDHQIQLKMKISSIKDIERGWVAGLSVCDRNIGEDIPGRDANSFTSILLNNDYDGAFQVGLVALNNGLRRHFEKKLLNVCKNSSKVDICENQALIAGIEKIEIVRLPEVKYDGKRRQFYLSIPKLVRKKSVLGSNVLGEIIPFFGQKAWGGRVYFTIEVAKDPKKLDFQVVDFVGDIKFNDTSIFGVITSILEGVTFFLQDEILKRRKSKIIRNLGSDVPFPAAIQFKNVRSLPDSVILDINLSPTEMGDLFE